MEDIRRLEEIVSKVEWAKENGVPQYDNLGSGDIEWLIKRAKNTKMFQDLHQSYLTKYTETVGERNVLLGKINMLKETLEEIRDQEHDVLKNATVSSLLLFVEEMLDKFQCAREQLGVSLLGYQMKKEQDEQIQRTLKFYADEENYVKRDESESDTSIHTVDLDQGDMARAALTNIRPIMRSIEEQEMFVADRAVEAYRKWTADQYMMRAYLARKKYPLYTIVKKNNFTNIDGVYEMVQDVRGLNGLGPGSYGKIMGYDQQIDCYLVYFDRFNDCVPVKEQGLDSAEGYTSEELDNQRIKIKDLIVDLREEG